MSLLALVSSQRLTVSQSAFINQITASTLNVSSIGGGNLIGQTTINSTVQGLGSLGYVSSPTLFSTIIGLGSANYVSTASLVSTTASLQAQFQTAGFLSSPTLVSTVAGLGTATYISSAQLLSTSAGINALLGAGLVTSNLTSTVAGIGTAFTISSLNLSSINKVAISQSTLNTLLLTTDSVYSGTFIKISLNGGSTWQNVNGDFTTGAYGAGYNGTMWLCAGQGGGSLKYSYDAVNWSNVLSGGTASLGRSVAWNGKYWLAFGSSNASETTIKYSYNGLNWSNVTSGAFTGQGYAAAWNGNMWVALGSDANSVKYSYDGLNWSNRNSGTSLSAPFRVYNSVCFGKNIWVIVGTATSSNAAIQYSYDGINWSNAQGSVFNYNLSGSYLGVGVSFNGSIFVAGGLDSNNGARYSYDGITWYQQGGYQPGLTAMIWTGRFFFASGDSSPGSCYISYDGITWNSTTSPNNSINYNLAYSSNAILPYDQLGLQITNNFIYNTYGSWNSTCMIQPQAGSLMINDTLKVDRALNRVGINSNYPRYTVDVNGTLNTNTLLINTENFNAYMSSTAIALSNTLGPSFPSTISTSYGRTFVTSNLTASTINFVNIQPSLSNFWVATGSDTTQNNRIQYSLNGSNWIASSSNGFTGRVNAVAFGGNIWVAVGQDPGNTSNTIYYSLNGLTWFIASGNFDAQGIGVAYNGRMWVAVGADNGSANNRVKYSFNGINWSNSTGASFGGSVHGAAWNGYMWVAVGFNLSVDNIKYSYNGINWSNASGATFSTRGYSVAWNGRLWVAVGTGNTATESIKYSYNGITWSNANTPGINIGYSVVWNGNYFLATGNDSFNATQISFDGINWSPSSSINGNALAWNGSLWQMVTSFSNAASIRYSFDGFTWTNSSGTGFSSEGFGVAFSSNTIPAYNQTNLSILPQNIPLFYTSTNTIFAQTSSIIINNTLEVDGQFGRVGINCNVPQRTLDVNGQTFMSSITTNIISTLRVQASTIAVLNVPTLLLWADATKAIAVGSTSVVSTFSNVFLGSNYLQSNGSSNAGMILPYSGSYMFEIGGWVCGSGNMTAGVIAIRGGISTVYQRIRAFPNPGCGISIVPFFWTLFEAGDRVQFYKNENNGSFSPFGLSPTMQVGIWNTTGGDDQQGPIKVWYYGGSGNI